MLQVYIILLFEELVNTCSNLYKELEKTRKMIKCKDLRYHMPASLDNFISLPRVQLHCL